jgi:hypothetical protein
MSKYFISSNVPFTEIEREEFIEVLVYGRPHLRNKMVKGDQMKKNVEAAMDDMKRWLNTYIRVSEPCFYWML